MAGHNQVIGGGGFHHISMQVRDLDASIKFYTEGLGFELRLAWGPAERRTVLLDTGDGNYLEISPGESDGFNPKGLIRHFAIRSDDCDKAIQAARAAGAEVTVEPKDVVLSSHPPTPVRVAFCKGPDGEVIEFFQDEVT
ncbi:MAG: VOC family protein [Anaerolineae bacterium]|nr:VOC family protein [Anaerolineae bacterium]